MLILLALLLCISTFAYMQYRENERYEKYLSLRLNNNLAGFTSGIVLSNDLLMEVIEGEKINYTQFSRLKDRIEWIGSNGNDMIDLANLSRSDKITSNEILGVSNKFRHYLRTQFLDKFSEDSNSVSLNEKEVFTLKQFQSLINLWAIELENRIAVISIPETKYIKEGVFIEDTYPYDIEEFSDYYLKDGINKKDWQILIAKIEIICRNNKK